MKIVFHYVKLTNPLSFQTWLPEMEQHSGGKWLIHGTNTHQDIFAFPNIYPYWYGASIGILRGVSYLTNSLVADDLTKHGAKEKEVDIWYHYNDVIMGAIASQITSFTIVFSTVNSDADQRKHQSSVSLAFVWGIHRGAVNSPHKWSVTQKMFPFNDVITMAGDMKP